MGTDNDEIGLPLLHLLFDRVTNAPTERVDGHQLRTKINLGFTRERRIAFDQLLLGRLQRLLVLSNIRCLYIRVGGSQIDNMNKPERRMLVFCQVNRLR